MTHNPADDFDHPLLPEGHPFGRHMLYRLKRAVTQSEAINPEKGTGDCCDRVPRHRLPTSCRSPR